MVSNESEAEVFSMASAVKSYKAPRSLINKSFCVY